MFGSVLCYAPGMKYLYTSIVLVALVLIALFLWSQSNQGPEPREPLVGGTRTPEGCLTPAGYSWDETARACVRAWEMTPGILEAARIAVLSIGESYGLTLVSFNSYEEAGAYDLSFEQGEERTPRMVYIRNSVVVPGPDHDEIERVGYRFMQDVVLVAPPNTDTEAERRLYDSLSRAAQEQVTYEMLLPDLARFVGIQDVPDQGVSVEDLEVEGLESALLTLGLNYSGGRVLRVLHLVHEEGTWKVQEVRRPVGE